jgi:hypothetical protein
MTVALRGIVDLFRKANRASEAHRRALGFSISHDDRSVRIHVHYPDIDSEKPTDYCETIDRFWYNIFLLNRAFTWRMMPRGYRGPESQLDTTAHSSK